MKSSIFTGPDRMKKPAKAIEPRIFEPWKIARLRVLLALCAFVPALATAQQNRAEDARQNTQGPENPALTEKAVTARSRMEELFVIGRKTSGLRGDRATAATLLDAELKDIPLNIGVIPRGLIELVNARDTRRVVEQNASVVTRTGHVQSFQGIFIRGFSNNGELNGRLKNGVPFYGVDSPIADNSALERVEVLKGAAGLLFGAASPGGVLNYVYKAPRRSRRTASILPPENLTAIAAIWMQRGRSFPIHSAIALRLGSNATTVGRTSSTTRNSRRPCNCKRN